MANTTNFGLKKFPPGALSDDGNQFSAKDRDVIDALLHTLFNHDHSDGGDRLADPSPLIFPDLTLGTSGTLPGSRVFYYKFSYVDENGNETRASTAGAVGTPSLLPAPPLPAVLVEDTGGILVPGTYRYALSYYQGTSAQTPATNLLVVPVPPGTNTNQVTLTFDTPPDEADGWKIYRRGPLDSDYYLLATVPVASVDYVDDGSATPDATKRRPTVNTTSANNSVLVAIPASELPLDLRVKSWRIYRSTNSASFPASSLVATVTTTTTEGGSDLVTSFLDVGASLGFGTPLSQSAIPPTIPQIGGSSSGLSQHATFMPGVLTVRDYNSFIPTYDMVVSKLEAFFLTPPTGVDTNDYVTLRVSDDDAADEVQSLWVSTTPRNEVQRITKSSNANPFTLTFDGETTASIVAVPTTLQIKAALEALPNVDEVFVSQVTDLVWDVQFSDPGGQDVPEMTGVTAGGTITVITPIPGTTGGDLTLSDGVDETDPIMFDDLAATLETRLETDIASIVDVSVTGTGTEIDPWIITFLNPGDTPVSLLQVNASGLNGTAQIERVTRGHGPTVIDLDVQTTDAYQSWSAPASGSDSQEAEDAPAVSGGVDVSDARAGNGVATEIDGAETVVWTIGVLPAGRYIARFFVAPNATQTRLTVQTDGATPVLLVQTEVFQSRDTYLPAYEFEFDSDGVVGVEFEVRMMAGTSVRVDKFEWELISPVLRAGAVCTVEALVTGSPSTNGSDVQFSIWH
jgi:hypothetical protein